MTRRDFAQNCVLAACSTAVGLVPSPEPVTQPAASKGQINGSVSELDDQLLRKAGFLPMAEAWRKRCTIGMDRFPVYVEGGVGSLEWREATHEVVIYAPKQALDEEGFLVDNPMLYGGLQGRVVEIPTVEFIVSNCI